MVRPFSPFEGVLSALRKSLIDCMEHADLFVPNAKVHNRSQSAKKCYKVCPLLRGESNVESDIVKIDHI